MGEAIQPYASRKTEITIEDDPLLWGSLVIVPKCLQANIFKELHKEHPGISKMKALARVHVWWPHLDAKIEEIAKNCQSCQARDHQLLHYVHPWTWLSKPLQRVHIDWSLPWDIIPSHH